MKARDVMIPVSDCAQVSEDHSLQSAMIMLSAYRQRFRNSDFPPRFVLVHDADYRIIGVLRHVEILKALSKAAGPGVMSMERLIEATPRVPAKDAMIRYSESERISADASVEDAIERMLSGSFRHLLVLDESGATIGIVRLSEIFARVRKDIGKAVQD